MESAHDGADLDVEDGGDFLVGEAVDFAQGDDGALFFGEGVHGGGDLGAQFGALGGAFGIDAETWGQGNVARRVIELKFVVELDLGGRAFAAVTVDGEVVGDAINPGKKVRIGLIFVDVVVEADKDLLGDFEGVLLISQDTVGDTDDTVFVAPV